MATPAPLTPEQADRVARAQQLGAELGEIQARRNQLALDRSHVIADLRDSGMSIRRIAAEVGLSIGPIQDALERHDAHVDRAAAAASTAG